MDQTRTMRKDGNCPYFLKDMQTCNLRRDGFYLPPKVHLLLYCQTEGYRGCADFKRCHPIETYSVEQPFKKAACRRRFSRIAGQWNVLIRSCDLGGTGVLMPAVTVDFSQGGMRIAVKRELPVDIPLFFVFGKAFPIPGFYGVAQLCWLRKWKDTRQGIQAGLAFDKQRLLFRAL